MEQEETKARTGSATGAVRPLKSRSPAEAM